MFYTLNRVKQLCTSVKTHLNDHFKCVHFIVCALFLNKVGLKIKPVENHLTIIFKFVEKTDFIWKQTGKIKLNKKLFIVLSLLAKMERQRLSLTYCLK